MAVKVLHLADNVITAGVLATLTETDPAGAADENQGWTVDKKGATNYAIFQPDTVGAAANFSSNEPSAFSAYGYRTTGALNGQFADSDWSLAVKVKSNAYYAQTGYVKFRLWRSANADGSGATQITSGWVASTLVSFTAANQYQTKTITWSPGGTVTLSNEYLFLEIEWATNASGGNNSAAVYFVEMEGAAEALTTPDFAEGNLQVDLASDPATAAGSGIDPVVVLGSVTKDISSDPATAASGGVDPAAVRNSLVIDVLAGTAHSP